MRLAASIQRPRHRGPEIQTQSLMFESGFSSSNTYPVNTAAEKASVAWLDGNEAVISLLEKSAGVDVE